MSTTPQLSPGSDPRLLVNIFGVGKYTMSKKHRLPHHGRGGSKHVGRTRIRLAAILTEYLGYIVSPDELQPSGGRQRNNTTQHDGYAWELFAYGSGQPFVAGSFNTMTDCVKAGRVTVTNGEISADYSYKSQQKH
tara:strand:+ start:172 stop:576 length:405 start_codon:yes stop_codon:yes gene_type:complete